MKQIEPLYRAMARAMRPGGKAVHIVPNTHDTMSQLLEYNLGPLPELRQEKVWKVPLTERVSGRKQDILYTPLTHSEFISDYRQQFDVNSSEHYMFPLIESGL